MGVTAQTAAETFIGAGDVYVNGNPVGATLDNNLFRIVRDYFTPDFNGVPGPVKGMDYIQMETAELEVTIPELSSDKLGYAVPGSTSAVGDAQGVSAAGLTTTLAANSLAGATNIKATSVTGASVGDVIQVGAAGAREFRRITVVGTAGAGGTGLDLDAPLGSAHTSGDAIVEVVSTTLAADAPAGSTNLKLASVAGLAAGDYLRFGYGGEQEARLLTNVGTGGAGGSGVDFDVATTKGHRTGDFAIEQTNEGSTVFTSTTGVSRRLASTAYNDWELRVPGLDGREARFKVMDAIMIDNAEFEAADDGTLAPRLKLQARWDPASAAICPWQIERIGPTA